MRVTCPECGGKIEIRVSTMAPAFRYGSNDWAEVAKSCHQIKGGKIARDPSTGAFTCSYLEDQIRADAIGGHA